MKIALQSDDENYQKFAEITDAGLGFHNIKFTSKWAGATDPEAEQTLFNCLLDKTGIENLKKLLETNEINI